MAGPRNVLITGASGGIGAAAAALFARGGDRVLLGFHQNEAAAQALCRALRAEGCAVLAAGGDVRTEEGAAALFCAAEDAFGAVDVLVNNAGTAQQAMFCDISPAEWDDMFAVHVRGAYLCCRRALPAMVRKKQGVILNISSMWGQVGASCEVHYSAAKAALIGFTRALAKEMGPSGIRVNCVAPGAVETPMLAGLCEDDRRALCAETPLGRIGTPEEIAAAIHYLASEGAAFITGQVLAPNGGCVV